MIISFSGKRLRNSEKYYFIIICLIEYVSDLFSNFGTENCFSWKKNLIKFRVNC